LRKLAVFCARDFLKTAIVRFLFPFREKALRVLSARFRARHAIAILVRRPARLHLCTAAAGFAAGDCFVLRGH